MHIYVSEHGDTLRKIANKYDLEIEHLLSINPHLSGADLKMVAGVQVKLSTPPPKPTAPASNQWIPLTPIEKMAETDYDVLIVGSGAGGGAVLWRLCEKWGSNNKKIGMIEAGDLLLPTHAFNLPTFNEESVAEYWAHVADLVGRRWPDYPGAKIIRALGGRTLLWYNYSPRFEPSAFRSWPITYSEIEPYYEISEKVMSVTKSYAKGSALQEILLERLLMGGFPEATDISISADLEGTKYGQVHSNVFFSSLIFLAYALNRRKFDLAIHTRAVQVLTENGKATGVKVMTSDKKTYTLKARTIVISASTWETPRLLLNSNIPGEAIGRYIQNHTAYIADASIQRDQIPEVLGVASIRVPGSADRSYQLMVFSDLYYHYKEKPLSDIVNLKLHGYGIIEPRVDNFVYLDPVRRDEYNVPLLNVKFSYSDKDQALLQKIHAALLTFTSTMNLTLVTPPYQWVPGLDNHETGTCRMGDDPSTSVTNGFGQVHGISSLYLADNSVVSLSSPANPTLTTVALAIRTADHIIDRTKCRK